MANLERPNRERKTIIVNNKTGEIIEDYTIVSHVDIKGYRKSSEDVVEKLGRFYHLFYKKMEENSVIPAMSVRLLRLCCYLSYDNNYLVIGNTKGQRRIKANELGDILLLKNRETINVKKYLSEKKLILIDKNHEIKVDDKICKKGSIKMGKDGNVTRIFEDGFNKLYEQTSSRQHKTLGYLIQLLPYVNIKYNCLCFNPKEIDTDKIEGFNFKDVWNILDISNRAQRSRVKQEIFNLKVNNLYVVGEFNYGKGNRIYINPYVFFKGNDIAPIKFLTAMFEL